MSMKKIGCLIIAALGLLGEVYACVTYANDISKYDPILQSVIGYNYELPFSTHETVITLIAIFAGLALIAGLVMFFGNEKESTKAD